MTVQVRMTTVQYMWRTCVVCMYVYNRYYIKKEASLSFNRICCTVVHFNSLFFSKKTSIPGTCSKPVLQSVYRCARTCCSFNSSSYLLSATRCLLRPVFLGSQTGYPTVERARCHGQCHLDLCHSQLPISF
jgi:hypothetical protein